MKRFGRNKDKRGGKKPDPKSGRKSSNFRERDHRENSGSGSNSPADSASQSNRKFRSYADIMAFDPERERRTNYGRREYDRSSDESPEGSRERREPRNGRQSPIKNMVSASSK